MMVAKRGAPEDYAVIGDAPQCCACHQRKGTEHVDCPPGGCLYVCRQCIVESQLKHASEQAARIPELEKELAELTGREAPHA